MTIPTSFSPGEMVEIDAIIGNGGAASAHFRVTGDGAPLTPKKCAPWLFFGIRGVRGPGDNDRTEPFITASVVRHLQQTHGTENVEVQWLDYNPATVNVFLTPEVDAAVAAARQTSGTLTDSAGTSRIEPVRIPKKLPKELTDSVAIGVSKAIDKLTSIKNNECADQHVVLAGYSEGAWILGDALQIASKDLDPLYSRIDHVFLWGDPKFDPRSVAAVRPERASQRPGPLNSIGIAAYALKLRSQYLPDDLEERSQSYCSSPGDPIDPVCSTPSSLLNGEPTGFDWAAAMDTCRSIWRAGVTEGVFTGFSRINPQSSCGHLRYTGAKAVDYMRLGP
ncbi:cutinase family protein [Streptomyces sp. NPDC019531]|uniref:cutinase family protein n=1 Tax=Streptomyces sp. NPDC019531 TaxID=3365062 RepID=UPI00384F71C5